MSFEGYKQIFLDIWRLYQSGKIAQCSVIDSSATDLDMNYQQNPYLLTLPSEKLLWTNKQLFFRPIEFITLSFGYNDTSWTDSNSNFRGNYANEPYCIATTLNWQDLIVSHNYMYIYNKAKHIRLKPASKSVYL